MVSAHEGVPRRYDSVRPAVSIGWVGGMAIRDYYKLPHEQLRNLD
jgi:hypothetical protein